MPPAEHATATAASRPDQGCRSSPTYCSSCKAAGDAAAKNGDWRAAAEAYSAALAYLPGSGSDPQFHGALLANRCLARLQLGEAAAALADARQAVRVRPRWGKSHLRLGQALQACDDADAAVAAFHRAAELDPALEAAAASATASAERAASRRRCSLVLQARGEPLYDAAVRPQALSLGSLTTQLIATGGSDAVIRLWCSLTGRLLQQLRGHSDRVTRLAWSPCGSLLASASLDGTVRMWQLQGCAEPPAAGGQNGPGSRGGELGLMSPAEGPVVSSQGGRPSCLAFSPDSALLAVGTSEGTVWLVGTGTAAACADDGSSEGASDSAPAALWRCQKLSGHGALVSAVSFSPCGRLLASASGDGLCKLWDASSGSEVAEIAADSGPVNHCAFVSLPLPPGALPPNSSSGSSGGGAAPPAHLAAQKPSSLLVTCHIKQQRLEGRVLLWDAVGRKHGWVDGKICGPVASLDDYRGKVVAAEGWCSGQADAGLATSASSCESRSGGGSNGGGSGPSEHATSSGGSLLATACNDGTVKMYDLMAIAPLAGSAIENGSKAAKRATAPLWELVMPSCPGAGGGGGVPAWSAAAMSQAAHERNRLALSPDGRQLAVAGPDIRLLILDAESGEQLVALAGHSAAVRALRWLAPGRLLSAAEDGTARIWNVGPTGQA